MSALQFLGKKSWHVGTKKNEEKVWLREQAAQKEAARVAELQKQLEEERRLEEARRLEVASGRSGPSTAPRVGWMYEDPGAAMPGTVDAANASMAAAEAAQEDALLGKKEAVLPVAVTPKHAGVDEIARNAASSSVVDDQNIQDELVIRDAEAKLREDPLLSIRRSELEVRKSAAERGLIPKSKQERSRESAAYISRHQHANARPPLGPDEVQRKAEKKARKEERARIREERKGRRNERSKRARVESARDGLRKQGETVVPLDGPKREKHKRARVEENGSRDSEERVLASGAPFPFPGEVRNESVPTDRPDGYGLRLPAGGTRVAVQTRHEPKGRNKKQIARDCDRTVSRWAPRSRPQSEEERAERLARMQSDAGLLEKDRALRLKRLREDEDAEIRMQSSPKDCDGEGPRFMMQFGRVAMAKAERGGVGHRIHQRKGSLTPDID